MSLTRIKELTSMVTISDIVTESDIHLGELIDRFLDANNIHNFDGPTGVDKFVKLTKALDKEYSTLEYFLEDNPGAFEVLLKWLRNSNVKEWKENLRTVTPTEEEDE